MNSVSGFWVVLQAGLVEPRVKTEEVPEKNDGPVKVVVAKQFSEIVFSGKNGEGGWGWVEGGQWAGGTGKGAGGG